MVGRDVEETMGEEVFYRYMSRAEREVIEDTGMLRGGDDGPTFWTDEVYDDPREARARLALGDAVPEVRLAFRLASRPKLMLDGAVVEPTEDRPGGGIEYMTTEKVSVEVVDEHFFGNQD